jgi:predicted TIM-barrel fold metal-dependent hydrolase
MVIVDAQVHIWSGGTPSSHHRQEPFGADDLLAAMAAAGVDRAVLVPPTWDPDARDIAFAAAGRHPDRFAVMGGLPLDRPESRAELPRWREQTGALGLRFSFNAPQTQAWLTDGVADWVWPAAERAGLPVAVLAPGVLPAIGAIARSHPSLRIIVDHLGIPRGLKDAAAFAHLPELLALAALPNVAVKAAGLPAYASKDLYPYRSLHPYLRQVIDAFGAERVFWGTDLSRMSCSYRTCVTVFTEELDWLSARELELIMGGALCRWIGWPLRVPERQ